MLSRKLTIDRIPKHMFAGKRVLLRADFNVPLKQAASGQYEITDPKRIESTLPSIQYCLDQGAKSVVCISHLGRPEGMPVPKYSLKPIHSALGDLLNQKVDFMEMHEASANNCAALQ